MKLYNILTYVLILLASASSAAPFVTPGMMKRNGLTDEQYAYLWSIGRNPNVDQATMRDWYFKSHRYPNVTNWLDICGTSNNFAKLSYKLQDDNFKLEETNEVITAENNVLTASNVVLEVELEISEVDANKARNVMDKSDKAQKKDSKNFEKWVKDTEKAKSKSSEEMAEFYDSILELAIRLQEEE